MLPRPTTSQSSSSRTHRLSYSDVNIHKHPSTSIDIMQKRKDRYPDTPEHQIPGLDFNTLSTEKIEYLLSTGIGTGIDQTPATRKLRIKGAHTLATRFIEGDLSTSQHRAPYDPAKAFTYVEMEINALSIHEIEVKLFNLDASNNVTMMPWQNISDVSSIINKNKSSQDKYHFEFASIKYKPSTKNTDDIAQFIKKWNDQLNTVKAADPNAIILAWEYLLGCTKLAEHYRKLKKEKRDLQSALAAKFYKQAVKYLAEHEPPTNWLASILLKIISPRFNSIRLFIIRLNKFLTQFNAPLLVKPFFRWLATFAGLYFLGVLLVDISVLFRAFFRNAKGRYDLADNLPAFSFSALGAYFIALADAFNKGWARLTQAFWEDNRPSRMANDALWFSINFTCLMLTLFAAPAIAPLWIAGLTIAGCLFDLGAEIAIGAYGFKTINELLAPIKVELEKLAHIDITKKFSDQEIANDPEGTKEYIQKISEKKSLTEARDKLVKKRVALELNRAHVVMIMAVLTIAAAILFFPPAAMPFAPVIAATTAFVMGSVFGGLGKYLFWNAPEFYKSGKGLALKGVRSVNEWLFGKVKQPLYDKPLVASTPIKHQTADDFAIDSRNTQQINRHFAQLPARLAAAQRPKTTTAPSQKTDFNLLHRSPSGTLFVDERLEQSANNNVSFTANPQLKPL